MDDIELATMLGHEFERITLVELEWIVGPVLDIDSDHLIESSPVVSHTGTTSATE